MLRIATLFTGMLLADVVPHCGGPEVVIQDPGESCGHHGPRWRGDCRAPADCFDTDEHGAVCTAKCEQDADCAALGAGFTCTAHGVRDADQEARTRVKVCGSATNTK